jgi:hypothetical protein
MVIQSFIPPFLEAKFCGVPSCVLDKLGCAEGEKSLQNAVLGSTCKIGVNRENAVIYSSHYFTLPTNMLSKPKFGSKQKSYLEVLLHVVYFETPRYMQRNFTAFTLPPACAFQSFG